MVPISREKFRTPCVKSNMFKCFSGLWYQISYLIEMVIELTYIIRLCCFIKMGHYVWIVKLILNIFPKVSHATTIMRCRVDSWNHLSNTWMPIRDNAQLICILYEAFHILKKNSYEVSHSLSTTQKATGNTWFSASCATADNRTPPYLLLRNVPSTAITFLISWKPIIQATYDTKKYYNLSFFSSDNVVLLPGFATSSIYWYALSTAYPCLCVPLTLDLACSMPL